MCLMKKILIVDGDESIRLLYKKELAEDGYQVSLACSEEDALGKIRNAKPDLIALGNHSTELDGIEFMKKLSENKWKIPVILGTAEGRYKQNFRVWSSEAHVIKSSDLTELKLAVKEIFAPLS